MSSIRLRLRAFAAPFLFFFILVLSFGLLIPVLGFYWDDWPVIFTGRLLGAPGFLQFYEYDRPVSAWTYIVTFPILGSRPANWHVFTLLLRWGTTVMMWWTLVRLWPRRRAEATWAALLFAIYPVFTQQSISVAYSQHWICFLLYFFSLGAMVQAYRSDRRWFWPLTILSLAASLLHLLTMEYFAGLELLRPLILWYLASEQPQPGRAQLRRVLRLWLPYLLVLSGCVIWRLFFLEFPGVEAANPPSLLYRMLETPFTSLLRFAQISLQDTIHLLVSVWANIPNPTSIDLTDRFVLFSWAIALATAAGLAYVLAGSERWPHTRPEDEGRRWITQIFLLGIAGILLGMLPVWFTDRQMIAGYYSDRFGLPAMFGASLVVVGLLELFIRLRLQRIVLLSLLVGMAVGLHLRTGNEYQWAWVKQTRFYWQLAWRAPTLQPGTAIFSDGEIFPRVGLYSTSMAINLLYPLQVTDGQMPYWFSSLGREFDLTMDEFKGGLPVERGLRFYRFSGDTRRGIVIYYDPTEHDCLHVLSPEDSKASFLPEITVQAALNSDLSRITAAPQAAAYPPVEIFGPEPEHGWCYFYQKGSLAWQNQDWQQVAALGDEALQEGFGPQQMSSNTPLEWMPFVEGYARMNRWEEAQDLSAAAYEMDNRMQARLCQLWDRLADETGTSPARDAALQAVRAAASCP